MMKNVEVYIDGDILPYEIGFATQRTLYFLTKEGLHNCSPFLITKSKRVVNKYLAADPDIIVHEEFQHESPVQAINTLKLRLQSIVKGSGCKTFKVVLSGPTNFRNDIATIQPYKGNREDFVKPVNFDVVRNFLLSKSYTILSENEEADDVVSRAMMDGHIGATIDKDLDNTPGLHYNFRKNLKYNVSEFEADYNFYKQMLTGDRIDNIPGIRGIGDKTADKLLKDCNNKESLELAVYDVYEKHYEDPIKAMTEVGRLLWMRREPDEMWEPFIV